MKFPDFFRDFTTLLDSCPSEALTPDSKFLFLSDLHMGDGGPKDDLAHNGGLLKTALLRRYLDRGFTLVLNGDIEDLSKFGADEIRSAWAELYAIFDEFAARGRLRKIAGNHDAQLSRCGRTQYETLDALCLSRGSKRIAVFHGHQASGFFVRLNRVSDLAIRLVAKPLRIKNASISGNSRRRFKAESWIYRASKRLGIISISGHTHRPLFESRSKYDSLRWSIEESLREYAMADQAGRDEIAGQLLLYRAELRRLSKKSRKYSLSRSLYEQEDLMIPCVFNSGCATGKNGITAIEIEGDAIRLVHWTGVKDSREYIESEALGMEAIEGTRYRIYVLKQDYLDQVFARIELLGGTLPSISARASAEPEGGSRVA